MLASIEFHPVVRREESAFSILIPTWSNLAYLKCCINSIRKNSRYTHQIIVHVNEGKDGTVEWLKAEEIAYTYSAENVGVCYGFNAPASLAYSQYLVLSDDDLYYAPDWDHHLMAELEKQNTALFCITGTMIEHSPTQYGGIIAPHNFGKTVENFEEERFLNEFSSIPFADWTGGNWYPMVLHAHLWSMIGGLSIEFSPGMGSDPDMMMKLWQSGVRFYKGVSKSRVYHFGSKTTGRVVRNDGNNQFLLKWGLSKSTFFNHYLRLGQPFTGETKEPDLSEFRMKKLRDKTKRIFSFWR